MSLILDLSLTRTINGIIASIVTSLQQIVIALNGSTSFNHTIIRRKAKSLLIFTWFNYDIIFEVFVSSHT